MRTIAYARMAFFMLCILLLRSDYAIAQEAAIQELTAPDLKKMLDNRAVTLVNVLSGIEYDVQHIPGSINIPIIFIQTTDKLPADKGAPLVFHCLSDRWLYAYRAARIAVERGYGNVFTFHGGIPEWRSFNYPLQLHAEYRKIPVRKIPPQELAMLLHHEKDMYILDVRPLGEQCLTITPKNFSLDNTLIGGPSIAGTFYCPLVYLEEHYTEIPPDSKIIISDWVMKQASFAAKFLIAKGYNVIGILKGGVKRWQTEGMPVQELRQDSDETILCD